MRALIRPVNCKNCNGNDFFTLTCCCACRIVWAWKKTPFADGCACAT